MAASAHRLIEDRLLAKPTDFTLWAALRWLSLIRPGQALRFRINASLAFAPSCVVGLRETEEGPLELTLNFPGLTGVFGTLPIEYRDLVLKAAQQKQHLLVDLLDFFNDLLIRLRLRAWECETPWRDAVVNGAAQRDKPWSPTVREDTGREGPPALTLKPVTSEFRDTYRNLAAHGGAIAGCQALGDYYGATFRVVRAPDLDARDRPNAERSSLFTLQIGPISDYQKFLSFLPGMPAWQELLPQIWYLAGDTFDCQLRLVVQADQVPALLLTGPASWITGWSRTWLTPTAKDALTDVTRRWCRRHFRWQEQMPQTAAGGGGQP